MDDANWRWIYVVSPVGRRKKQPVCVVAEGQNLKPKAEMETANLLGINGLQKSHQTAGMASIFQNCFCSNSLPQPGHFNFGFRAQSAQNMSELESPFGEAGHPVRVWSPARHPKNCLAAGCRRPRQAGRPPLRGTGGVSPPAAVHPSRTHGDACANSRFQPVGLAQRLAPKAWSLDFSGVIETVQAQNRIKSRTDPFTPGEGTGPATPVFSKEIL